MAKLVSSGKDLGYTIIPYTLDNRIQFKLFSNPSDYALGYIKYNEYTDIRKFTYTESGKLISDYNHWSLDILKEFPYCEQSGPWILYSCPPEQAKFEFDNLLSGENLHIHNWDTWSVVGKNAKVAFITSWEIF